MLRIDIHRLGAILLSLRSYHILLFLAMFSHYSSFIPRTCIVRVGDICNALRYSNQYFPYHFTIQLTLLPYCPYLFTIRLAFLPYFPYLFTIQLTFLPYFPNHFTIQLTFSSIFSISFHYSTYFSSILSKSYHYST